MKLTIRLTANKPQLLEIRTNDDPNFELTYDEENNQHLLKGDIKKVLNAIAALSYQDQIIIYIHDIHITIN